MTQRIAGVAAVALAVALAGCGGGGGTTTGSTGTSPTANAPAPGPKNATDSAYAFLDGYVDPTGRVVRRDQGGDTVSEGQAYAMLAAAAVGDGQRFDKIWGWTSANLKQPNGLLASQWANGKIVNPQPAADADLDAARALLVASCKFKRPDLKKAALDMGKAILSSEVRTHVLVAGPWATKSPVTFNPSYFDSRTLDELGKASGDSQYAQVRAGTLKALAAVMQPLAPDWAQLDSGGTAHGVAHPSGPGPGQSTFDAPRTLVRLAEAPEAQARALAAKAWPVLKANPAIVQRSLNGAPAGGSQAPVALVGAAGAAQAAGDANSAGALLQQARAQQKAQPTYYGAGVIALASLLLQTHSLDACS